MTTAIRLMMVAALVAATVFLPPRSALAHGEAGEGDSVDLVEQALAIVVNTPDASGEALERVEAAIEKETEDPSGLLDVTALGDAAAALEAGDLHEAEDALVLALGTDPHEEAAAPDAGLEAPAEETPPRPAESDTTPPGDDAPQAPVETDEAMDEVADEVEHGLTEREEGGWEAPSTGEYYALAGSGIALAAGLVIVVGRRKGLPQ